MTLKLTVILMVGLVETNQAYNSFLFSLDLFLPVSNLGFKNTWIPKPKRWFARAYFWIHRSVAWFHIPIAVLSVFGIIR